MGQLTEFGDELPDGADPLFIDVGKFDPHLEFPGFAIQEMNDFAPYVDQIFFNSHRQTDGLVGLDREMGFEKDARLGDIQRPADRLSHLGFLIIDGDMRKVECIDALMFSFFVCHRRLPVVEADQPAAAKPESIGYEAAASLVDFFLKSQVTIAVAKIQVERFSRIFLKVDDNSSYSAFNV